MVLCRVYSHFGPTVGGSGFIGDLSHAFLIGVGVDCASALDGADYTGCALRDVPAHVCDDGSCHCDWSLGGEWSSKPLLLSHCSGLSSCTPSVPGCGI